ncbi:cytochrome ubiquinol oxidase subunit I [Zooshikella ganghwensis]
MMEMDGALLSRIQFAWTVSFHILFPTITIGLASYLAIMEGLWLKTRNPVYRAQLLFWIKPFAVTFGMGVVSGIVLSYEFGTNFSEFSQATSTVLGPLLTYEVLTAFFLEAGFLGIMLFGWNRVSERMHFVATVIVAIGTIISAFWILAANSWMQTPAGAVLDKQGVFQVVSWMEVIFNPSFPYRLVHMLLASFLTVSFLIAGVSAWHIRKDRQNPVAQKGLSVALWAALVLAPLQAWVGDLHGLNVLEHQPIKVAAMEGIWETEQGAGLRLFAVPDQEQETNHFEVKIPYLASLILTHDAQGTLQGLKSVPADERPPVAVVFYSFRIMVGIGMLMLLAAVVGAWLRWRGNLYSANWFHKGLQWMIPAGLVATLAGWYVVEVGRQPWLVHGFLRTNDMVSAHPEQRVLFTLILFVIVYSLLFAVYLYFMCKLLKRLPSIDATVDEKESIKSQSAEYLTTSSTTTGIPS